MPDQILYERFGLSPDTIDILERKGHLDMIPVSNLGWANSIMRQGDELYGPWAGTMPTCAAANLAFELLTNVAGGSEQVVVWGNGGAKFERPLVSQFGGEAEDFLTVDDFELFTGETITGVEWISEEEPEFTWEKTDKADTLKSAVTSPAAAN